MPSVNAEFSEEEKGVLDEWKETVARALKIDPKNYSWHDLLLLYAQSGIVPTPARFK